MNVMNHDPTQSLKQKTNPQIFILQSNSVIS